MKVHIKFYIKHGKCTTTKRIISLPTMHVKIPDGQGNVQVLATQLLKQITLKINVSLQMKPKFTGCQNWLG